MILVTGLIWLLFALLLMLSLLLLALLLLRRMALEMDRLAAGSAFCSSVLMCAKVDIFFAAGFTVSVLVTVADVCGAAVEIVVAVDIITGTWPHMTRVGVGFFTVVARLAGAVAAELSFVARRFMMLTNGCVSAVLVCTTSGTRTGGGAGAAATVAVVAAAVRGLARMSLAMR